MSTLRVELLRLISNLPSLSDVPERKAFVVFTNYPHVGLYLDWSGSQVTFAEALIDELSRRGQRFTVSFLGAACQVPQVGPEAATHLRALAGQIERLRPDAWLSEFPVEPLTAQDSSALQADLDMLAGAVVSSTLLPYYALGANALATQAGARAAQVAEAVAVRVTTAMAGSRLPWSVLDVFIQKPVETEGEFLAGLRDLLDCDNELALDLAGLLTAEPQVEEVTLQAMFNVTQDICMVEGSAAGVIVGADTLDRIAGLSDGAVTDVQQAVETVELGGAVEGKIVGGREGAVRVGGQQQYSDVVHGDKTQIDTGGGVYVGKGVHTGGGEFIGRDKLIRGDEVHGDKVTALVKGDLIFQIFASAPSALSNHIRVRDFQNLIEDRTRVFVGREFVFAAIDRLLIDPEFFSGYIVIQGEPGIGKTALMAELVKRRGYVHHFNIALQGIRSTRDFLANICAQLIVRYELGVPSLPPEATRDSGFLSRLLGQVVADDANRPLVILVDALDEAEDTDLPVQGNRLFLPATLPPGVFFVVTSREEHDYRLDVDRREDIYLRDDDPHNLDDIRKFIRDFIQRHAENMAHRLDTWQVNEEEFVRVLTEKSQGNFMYLVLVLRDIHTGSLTPTNVDNIRNLPKGLRAFYQRHWRSMKAQDETLFANYYQPVLCILATVREPVTVEQVASWTTLDVSSVIQVVHTWREYLNEDIDADGAPRYRVYHSSFQDFLSAEVGLRQFHALIVQDALAKIPGF